MSKIYTKSGDKGLTGLANGSRIEKDSQRIVLGGSIDELNAHLGIILSHRELPPYLSEILVMIQNHLFKLGAEIALASEIRITDENVRSLEIAIDRLQNSLPELKQFILPGGSPVSAQLHLARTVARRCEQNAVTLNHQNGLNPVSLQYLNRLSDLLFVMARTSNQKTHGKEVIWHIE